MSYLVMETHPAYAVVLDEDGRFLKAANLRYQVGDRVQSIVELRRPKEAHRRLWKPLSGAAGLAACVCLVFFGWYQPNFAPYGALRIQINPDVELTLSRTDRVLELEGLNADGKDLIAGYDFQGKDREEATEDLMERAIDMGYLSSGDTVAITVTSSDAGWQAQEEQAAQAQLEAQYGETIVIRLGPVSELPPTAEVVIPLTPSAPEPVPESPPASPADDDDRWDTEDRDDDWDDDRDDDWDDNWDDDWDDDNDDDGSDDDDDDSNDDNDDGGDDDD